MIEGRATARYVRTSARKAKLVVDLIRGRDVDSALATLRFARKGVAKDVEKVLRSAIANAQQKEGAGDAVERLYVRECYADQGPTAKRIRAAPMGRAFRVLKRTSHLTVVVEARPEEQGASRKRRRRGGTGGVGSGSARGSERRTPAPAAAPEPDVMEPDTTPEPPAAEVPDATPEPEEREPEAPEPDETAEREAPEPEDEPGRTPEPEKKPDEPDEPAPLPPGGILGIR